MSTFKPRTQQYLRTPTNLYEQGFNLYGRKDSISASFGDSAKTMFDTVTFKNSIGSWYAGVLDRKAGEQPISKEYFDKYNDLYKTELDYDPKELPSQFALRQGNKIRANLKRSRINQRYGASNFVAAMVPELINPVNVIPFGRIATLGKFANKTAIATRQGQKFRAAFGTYKDYFKEALIGNAAVEPLYYLNAQSYGDDYTIKDSFLNIGLGTAIGTGFFGTVAAGMKYRSANRVTQQLQVYEEMYSFMESGEYGNAINVALEADPKFEGMLRKHTELDSLFNKQTGAFDLTKATPEQAELAASIVKSRVRDLFETSLTSSLSAEIAEELAGDTPIREVSVKYRTKFARIIKAYETGDTSNLSESDLETYRMLAKLPENTMFDKSLEDMSLEELQQYADQQDVEFSKLESQFKSRFTSDRYSDNGYEVSSAGDKRFSAFNATLKDGRTIEQAYQEAKGSGKGQPAVDPDFDYWGTYLGLWEQWAKENPELIEDLRKKADGKVLTDKFAKTENNQARALAYILNKTEQPPKVLDGPNFNATNQAMVYANQIAKIKYENNVSTLKEAVEKGAITKEDADTLLKAFYDHYAVAFADEIRIANQALNEIFGFNFKIKTYDYVGMPHAAGKMSDLVPEEILLMRAEDFARTYDSPAGTMFHEAMHSLKQFDRKGWQSVLATVRKHPKLRKKLSEIIKQRGYETYQVLDEIPSVFMEWAVTQKEFWQELSNRDRTFFEKFRDLLNKLFRSVVNFTNKSDVQKLLNRKEMKKLLSSGTPEDLARGFAQVLNASRNLRKFDSASQIIKDTINTSVNRNTRLEEPDYQETLYTRSEYSEPFKDFTAFEEENIYIQQNFEKTFERIGYLFEEKKADFTLMMNDMKSLWKYYGEDGEADAKEQFFKQFTDRGRELFEPIWNDFYKLSRSYDFITQEKQVQNFINQPLVETDARFIDMARLIKRRIQKHVGQGVDAEWVVNAATELEYMKRLYILARDFAVRESTLRRVDGLATGSLKLKALRTMLDGQRRKGTEYVNNSLWIDLEVAAEADAEVLMQVLHDYGMFDLFFGADDTEWIKAYRGTEQERNVIKKFGGNIKTASQEFHQQLMYALRNNVLPEDWTGVKGLEVLFETIQNLENFQLNKLAEVGAFTSKLDSFAGVSQRWDQTIVSSMTEQEFVSDMLNRLDIDATIEKHQGVYKVSETKLAVLNKETFNKWLKSWYKEIVSGKVDDAPDARIDARKSRLIVIKPEAEMETVLKYSGYDSIGKLMVEQIGQRARSVVLAQYGGSRPKEMWTSFAKGLRNDINKKSYSATVDYMMGDLADPVDAPLSLFFQKLGDFSDIVFLSGSGISSLTDIATSAMTLKYQGITLGDANGLLVDSYKDAVSRRFSGDRTGMGNFLRAQGAGWDVIQNSVVRRYTADGEQGRGLLAKGKKLFFKLNGLNALTNATQEMYFDVITRGIAEELKIWNDGGDMDDLLIKGLGDAGISDKEFSELYASIKTTPDGVDRIGVQDIKNPELSLKLRTYFKRYMREAVFMPDPGTYAQATFGFRRGTFIGEMTRVATRYQPFMLGMSKLLYRRFANGYFGKNNRNMMMMSHLVSYLGVAFATAYVATIIKDILKGNEPINLVNMTGRDFSRLVQQTGALGIFEVALDAADYGPLEATSPLVSTMFGIPIDLASGDKKGAIDKASSLTGGNILGPGEWLHGLIGSIFGEVSNDYLLGEVEEMEDLRLDY